MSFNKIAINNSLESLGFQKALDELEILAAKAGSDPKALAEFTSLRKETVGKINDLIAQLLGLRVMLLPDEIITASLEEMGNLAKFFVETAELKPANSQGEPSRSDYEKLFQTVEVLKKLHVLDETS